MADLVFYDGACGLCHWTVRFLLARDRAGAFRFAPLGGEAFRAALGPAAEGLAAASAPQGRQTVVVRTADGRVLVRSAAVLHALRRLGGGWRLLAGLLGVVPRPLLDAAYRLVARLRGRLFAPPPDVCPVVPAELRARFDLAAALVAAGALALGCAADGGGSLAEALRRAGVPAGQPLSEGRIAEGLKEALRVGTGNAVALVGRADGYLGNARIRIPMPEDLTTLERRLRQVGFGRQVDEFVASMNRAAERAAPEARRVFLDAVAAMTLTDARRILRGPDTAATDYFRGRTQAALGRAFRPIVGETLDQVGVTRQYRALVTRYNQIPLVTPQAADLDAYVTSRALDGLFVMLADEERRIRTDPAARVTALLREVFGHGS